MPSDSLASVEIASLPTCSNGGTPILLVSDQPDCENSANGTKVGSSETIKCLVFGGSEVEVPLGSVMFECLGGDISATPAMGVQTQSATGLSGSGHSSHSCCHGCDTCCTACWSGIALVVFLAVIGGCCYHYYNE